MSQESVLPLPVLAAPRPIQFGHLRGSLLRAGSLLALLGLLLAAWVVRSGAAYSPGKGPGYALGLTGGVLLLGLLLYPLRKRVRFMHRWGALKYWFRFHLIGGILGPVLVLFHSTFHIGSLNAAVALSCMLLVVASGVIGRFIYGKIHHGLYGSHASLKDMEQSLARQLEALAPALQRLPSVKLEVERFAALVSSCPAGRVARAAHFLSLGARRMLAAQRLRQTLAACATTEADRLRPSHADLNGLLQTINSTLLAAQRRAQFSTYDRLFALWHVIHIPFLCMLVITAIVHVVAVHAY
jgi:hypothetical protein